jgi:hypothetical protein
MRTFKLQTALPKTKKNPWEIIENINSYPNLVKFMEKAWLRGPFQVGSHWYDITSILWIPIIIDHKIVSIEKGKEVRFEIDLPFKGKMLQRLSLVEGKSLELEISFSLPKWLDQAIGPLLERRVKEMIVGTIENVKQMQD